MLVQKWIDELSALDTDADVRRVLDRKLKLMKANFEEGAESDLFLELLYCLLTAQTKFYSAARVVEELKYDELFETRLFSSSDKDLITFLSPILKKHIIRFHNNKSANIVSARNVFIQNKKYRFHDLLDGFDSVFEMREWLIANIRGFSYKEASHFLRNIGFGQNIAILDRHVLRILDWVGVLDEDVSVLSPKKYLEVEQILLNFSKFLGISVDRLDFLLFVLSKREMEKSQGNMLELLNDLK